MLLEGEDIEHDDDQTREAPRRTSKGRIAAVVAGAVFVAAVLFVGGLFVGQSTRMSDAEVANERTAAVTAAVGKAERDTTREVVAAQKTIRRKAIREARSAQKKHDRTVMRQLRRKLVKAAGRRAEQSYASGQSAGYSSGHVDGSVEGFDDGLTAGSDQLTCSDDPDAYWLPACGF